ncbi:MAG: lasso peptide biosynthesis B2 protein [Halioglobus sp.]
MARRINKFIALTPRHKFTLAQAWFMLGWYRAGLLLLSFKRLTRKLQHHALPVPAAQLPSGQREEALIIGRLVAAASRITPWQSLCLTQVLVVQRLLAKRNIPGQFYLGVRRGGELTDDPTGLSAHAWLQCGEDIVNGRAGHERFTVVSAFSWGPLGASFENEVH